MATKACPKRVIRKLKRYFCSPCGAMFSVRATRDLHLRLMHLDILKQPCPHCSRAFGLKPELERHIRTAHVHLSRWICPHCSAKFTQERHLTVHVLTVHSDSQEDLFPDGSLACDQNGHPEFDTWQSSPPDPLRPYHEAIERHIQSVLDNIHAPCPKEASPRVHSEKHASAKHHDYEVFMCSLCTKEFLKKGNLDVHVLMAHENRKY